MDGNNKADVVVFGTNYYMKKRIKNNETIIGNKYGFLTVLELSETLSYKRLWKCKCDCGNETISNTNELLSGKRYSCGCKNIGKERSTFKGYEEISGSWYTRAHQTALRKNLNWEITKEDIWNLFLLQNKKCAMTGWPILCKRYRDSKGATASIDRIDNNKGYTKDNIQLVHANVNLARHKMTIDEFIILCKLVCLGGAEDDKIAWI